VTTRDRRDPFSAPLKSFSDLLDLVPGLERLLFRFFWTAFRIHKFLSENSPVSFRFCEISHWAHASLHIGSGPTETDPPQSYSLLGKAEQLFAVDHKGEPQISADGSSIKEAISPAKPAAYVL